MYNYICPTIIDVEFNNCSLILFLQTIKKAYMPNKLRLRSLHFERLFPTKRKTNQNFLCNEKQGLAKEWISLR